MKTTLKYGPGNLLREYSIQKGTNRRLEGVFFIIDIDDFDAQVICFYDRDGYYRLMSPLGIPHKDLHKNSRFFSWEIS